MPIIAMNIITADKHPNADALRIYQLASASAPDSKPTQIVANCDTVYEVGDLVAAALPGTVLADGTKINKARLRGVDSFGMILGVVSKAVSGDDLSAEYGAVEASSGPATGKARMIHWASIELLHNVVKRVDSRPLEDGETRPMIRYRAKVKLDGTNAGIQVLPDGSVFAQSRSRILKDGEDNSGFRAWVESNSACLASLAKPDEERPMVVFGEWCGQGIQKRTSISQIDRKIFAVFAVQYCDSQLERSSIIIDPGRIRDILPEHPDIYILPWFGDEIQLDFGDREALKNAADAINALVLSVENCDPWVQETFGREGVGEGLVLYPQPEADSNGEIDRDDCTDLMFKAKGEKHQVVKQREPAQIDPEVAASVADFVDRFVTEARLMQGATEACGGDFAMAKMGEFLRWFGQDVKKESESELEASGLEWKDVGKAVTTAARSWFKDRSTEL